jgi:hypothetical protein
LGATDTDTTIWVGVALTMRSTVTPGPKFTSAGDAFEGRFAPYKCSSWRAAPVLIIDSAVPSTTGSAPTRYRRTSRPSSLYAPVNQRPSARRQSRSTNSASLQSVLTPGIGNDVASPLDRPRH